MATVTVRDTRGLDNCPASTPNADGGHGRRGVEALPVEAGEELVTAAVEVEFQLEQG
jgi:hypothetical protein